MSLGSRARWALAGWLAFVLACVAVMSRTEFTADFSAFLPRSPSPVQQVLVDQLREGVVSRLILIGVEGAEAPLLARTSMEMASRLRRDERFTAVRNGQDVGLEKDREYFWANRYLLSPAVAPEHFTRAALHESLQEGLSLLGSPAGPLVQRILPNDPTGELIRLLEQLEGQAKPPLREGVWFSPDGKRALLLAQTRAPGYDIDAQQDAVDAIQRAYREATPEAELARMTLLLSGPGVFSVASRARIERDALVFSVIATGLVAALLLALYRSPRVLGLGLLPVATGALAGIAAVSLGFGSVHGITLGFGATLIGESVDYAIYLFTQTSPGTASDRTLDRIWPTLRLGVLTSVCGYSAMLLSGFPGLAQLGLFSIAGLIVAAAVTRWVLPALVPSQFSIQAVSALAPHVHGLTRRAPAARYVAWLLVAASGAVIAVHGKELWQDDLAGLSAISPGEQKIDGQLRRDIGAPDVRHLIALNADSEQAALEAAEDVGARLQQAVEKGWLQSFESPATYLPSQRTQRARQASLPDTATLQGELTHAAQGLPFRAGVFEPFLRDVAAAKAQPLLTRKSLQGTAVALQVESLLVQRSSGFLLMLPLRGVSDPAGIARELAGAQASALMIDLKRETQSLYAMYRGEAFRHALLGAAAVVVLLTVVLRSPRRVLSVVLPLAAAVIIVSASILLAGARLSIFHLVGLLLVIAVGSNYSLFFDRETASLEDGERTLVSLVFANLSTVIGFGLLSFSTVPILREIGSTVALGAILSLLLSAIFVSRSRSVISTQGA